MSYPAMSFHSGSNCLELPDVGRSRKNKAGVKQPAHQPPADDAGKTPRRVRTGTAINVYIDDDLAAAMEAHIDSAEPAITKTAYIEALIKADLRKQGRWPVQPRAEG